MRARLTAFVAVLWLLVAVQAQKADVVLDGSGTLETTGTLTVETPFVEYRVRVAEGGTLDADMRQAQDSILDSKLFLVNARDEIILQNDDCDNDRTRSCLTLNNMTAGEYRVIATRFSDKKLGDYTLKLTLNDTSPPPITIDVSDSALEAAGYPLGAPEEETVWTIFAYYGGDTDLERAIIEDLEEFEIAGGSNANVRVIAFLDRSLFEYVSADPEQEWAGARVYKLTASEVKEKDRRLESPMLFELDNSIDVNSADGETLAQFLVWGIRSFPSQRYAVAFASHGEGWAGLVPDYSKKQGNRAPMITVPELKLAFEAAQAELRQRGIEKFEVVINDACLMSSVEYHNATMSYFHYSVASPEIVLNPALDMGLMLTLLSQTPDLPMPDLGKALIDYYINTDMEAFPSAEKNNMASAVIDLARIPALDEAIEAFARIVNANPQAYVTTIGTARKNTYTYGSWNKLDQHIDLADFMRQVVLNSNDPQLIIAAQTVAQAARATIVDGKARDRVPNPSYLNIYFPSSIKSVANRYYVETPLPQWAQMLRDYYNAVDPQVWNREGRFAFHEPIEPTVKITNTFPTLDAPISTETGLTLAIEARGRKIARGWITIDQAIARAADDGTTRTDYIRLGAYPSLKRVPSEEGERYVNEFTPGVSFINETWDGYLYIVSDGKTTDYELLESTASLDTAVLEGRYRVSDADEWKDGALIFSTLDYTEDWTRKERRGQSLISRDGANSGLASILLPAGAQFQAYKSVVTADGGIQRVLGKVYTWGEEGLLAVQEPAPVGDYRVTFLMEAFGSQLGFDSVNVSVDNRAVDSVVRSYVSAQDGYVWRYDPTIWYDPEMTEQGYVFAQYGDELAFVEAYSFKAQELRYTPDAFGALRQYGDVVNVRLEYWDVPFEGRGFDYSIGTGIDANGNGYTVMAVETLPSRFVVFGTYTTQSQEEGDTEELVDLRLEVLQDIYNNLETFSTAFVTEDNAEWTLQNVSYSFQVGLMPLPKVWAQNAFDYAEWASFSPTPDGASSDTFVSVAQWRGDNARDALNALVRDYVESTDVNSSFERLDYDKPIYYGENYTWDVVFYRRTTKDDRVRVGRMYATRTDLGNIYAVWQETPETDDDADDKLFAEVFELMVDGFVVPNPIRTFAHPTLGISVSYPKAWYAMSESTLDLVDGVYEATSPTLVTRLAVYDVEGVRLRAGCVLGEALPARCVPRPNALIELATDALETDLERVQTFSLAGVEVTEVRYIPYTFDGSGELSAGSASGLLFFSPTTGKVGLVAFETQVGDREELDQLFKNLRDGWLRLPSSGATVREGDDAAAFAPDWRLHNEPTFSLYLQETWTDVKAQEATVLYNDEFIMDATVKTTTSATEQTAIDFIYVPATTWLEAGITGLEDFRLGQFDDSVPSEYYLISGLLDDDGNTLWEGRLVHAYGFKDESGTLGRALTTFLPETGELLTIAIYGDAVRGDAPYFAEQILYGSGIQMRYIGDYDPQNLTLGVSYPLATVDDWQELFSQAGLRIVPPTGWNAPEFNTDAGAVEVVEAEGIDGVYWEMQMYAYEESARPIDVAFSASLNNGYLLGQGVDLTLNGVPSLIMDAFYNDKGGSRRHTFLIVQMYDEFALVGRVGAYGTNVSPQKLLDALACYVRSVGLGVRNAPCAWETTTSTPLIDDVWLEMPLSVASFAYESDDSLWYGEDEEGETGVFVLYTEALDDPDATLEQLLGEYEDVFLVGDLSERETTQGYIVYEGKFEFGELLADGFLVWNDSDWAYLVLVMSYVDDALDRSQTALYTTLRDRVALTRLSYELTEIGNLGLSKDNYATLYDGTYYEGLFDPDAVLRAVGVR